MLQNEIAIEVEELEPIVAPSGIWAVDDAN